MANLVHVKDEDYLEQDPPLRGQNYVCLSFLSPEEILKKKDTFLFEKFVKSFSEDMIDFFEKLSDKYKEEVDLINTIKERYRYIFAPDKIQDEFQFFISQNGQTLESEFHEINNFQTTIRGIKIRGVFDTLKEAEIRAQVLKRLDNKFHVYVAEVGCWCPWSPNPDDIGEQEYAESHLNTLMKNYKDNQNKKDVFFEERKKELQFTKTKNELDKEDPWASKTLNNEVVIEVPSVTETPEVVETVTPEVVEAVTTEVVETVTLETVEVQEDLGEFKLVDEPLIDVE